MVLRFYVRLNCKNISIFIINQCTYNRTRVASKTAVCRAPKSLNLTGALLLLINFYSIGNQSKIFKYCVETWLQLLAQFTSCVLIYSDFFFYRDFRSKNDLRSL